MLSAEINYYMKVAIDINKKLGGTRAYEAEANSRDRFLVIRQNINKNFHFIRAKLQQRQNRKVNSQQINEQIRQKIQEIYNQLQRMRQAIANEKGVNPAAQTVKYEIVEKLTTQARELQDLLQNSSELEKKLFNKKEQTLTEKRQALLEGGKPGRFQSKPANNNGPTEIETQKMQEWKKRDEQIDEGIGQVLEGIKRWKEGLKITGELIDESDKKIVALTQQVDKVNDDLFKSNKQLKGIVQKFRKPHKFCIDIVLSLILIGLIVGIIKLSGA